MHTTEIEFYVSVKVENGMALGRDMADEITDAFRGLCEYNNWQCTISKILEIADDPQDA
jgi:hypothetical protein